jgi:RNA polymerase sigma-70 factor, ECF subfamily
MIYTQKTDGELCELVNKSDKQAFGELYVRYVDKLISFCTTILQDKDKAKDLAQGIFVTLWEEKKLSGEHSFSSYLFTIARNRSLNVLRQYSNETRAQEKLKIVSTSVSESTEASVQDKEYAFLFTKALDKLSPQKQRAFLLSRKDGLSHKEIALTMNISVYTVQEYVSDSMKFIKNYLSIYTGLHLG